jgi:hypothetical protein
LRRFSWFVTAACALTVSFGDVVVAQGLDGYASVLFDVFPDVEVPENGSRTSSGSRRTVGELRTRVVVERRFDLGPRVRLTAGAFVEGLVASRRSDQVATAAIVRPQEAHAEFFWSKADVRIGVSRLAWGRLDEFQPTDVVNPLDLTRFFFEGRAEARMPVGLVRARAFPSERFTLEAVYVPVFRRGRFDQLEEETSPFNLAAVTPDAVREPARAWKNGQGGLRASVTTGRVDWSVSGYRGFESLPLYGLSFTPGAGALPALQGTFPRFTMIGGDFETVHGEWGVRGELAAFVERTIQATNEPVSAPGQSFEAGIGVDRRAGQYRLSTNVVVARRTSEQLNLGDTDTLIVLSVDRSFARETRQLRTFAVYNPTDDSAFARTIASFHLRDDVTLEASGGWFVGRGADSLGRLATRDFLYTRLKVSF